MSQKVDFDFEIFHPSPDTQYTCFDLFFTGQLRVMHTRLDTDLVNAWLTVQDILQVDVENKITLCFVERLEENW